ncbi:MAG: hypothetical protein WKG07_20640 [Hymenobacter sp.]
MALSWARCSTWPTRCTCTTIFATRSTPAATCAWPPAAQNGNERDAALRVLVPAAAGALARPLSAITAASGRSGRPASGPGASRSFWLIAWC